MRRHQRGGSRGWPQGVAPAGGTRAWHHGAAPPLPSRPPPPLSSPLLPSLPSSGDRFPKELRVDFRVELDSPSVGSKMPNWWFNETGWQHGFNMLFPLLCCVFIVLQDVCASQEGFYGCRQLGRPAAQWLADAVGWIMLLIPAIACEGWLLPRGSRKRKHQEDFIDEGRNAFSDPPGVLGRLCTAVESGAAPCAVFLQCYR
jgi:hypothetical protein